MYGKLLASAFHPLWTAYSLVSQCGAANRPNYCKRKRNGSGVVRCPQLGFPRRHPRATVPGRSEHSAAGVFPWETHSYTPPPPTAAAAAAPLGFTGIAGGRSIRRGRAPFRVYIRERGRCDDDGCPPTTNLPDSPREPYSYVVHVRQTNPLTGGWPEWLALSEVQKFSRFTLRKHECIDKVHEKSEIFTIVLFWQPRMVSTRNETKKQIVIITKQWNTIVTDSREYKITTT